MPDSTARDVEPVEAQAQPKPEWITPEATKLDLETAQQTIPP